GEMERRLKQPWRAPQPASRFISTGQFRRCGVFVTQPDRIFSTGTKFQLKLRGNIFVLRAVRSLPKPTALAAAASGGTGAAENLTSEGRHRCRPSVLIVAEPHVFDRAVTVQSF